MHIRTHRAVCVVCVCVCVRACVHVCVCVCVTPRDTSSLLCTYFVSSHCSLVHISSDPLSVPSLIVDRVTNLAVEYRAQRNDAITGRLIAGYEVIRFGVPMIGQYVNAQTGRRVTISLAVRGAQYRITAWALGDGWRSATPAVVDATTGEASET